MNTQTSNIDEVIANVKNTLNSYDSAGLLQEATLLKHAEWIINRLKAGVIYENELVLQVDDYKADIPFNFDSLCFLYRCEMKPQQVNTVRYFYGNPQTFHVKDWSSNVIYNKCCVDTTETEIKRTIYIEQSEPIEQSFYQKGLLKYSGAVSKNRFSSSCPNLYCQSTDYFNFDSKSFSFNFKEGCVYIKYLGIQYDDFGFPLIEDDPYVKKALEEYLIYESFKELYYNGVADVAQKMQKAEYEKNSAIKEALFNAKLTSYEDKKRYIELKGKQYSKLNLPSNADAVHHKYQRYKQRY